MGLPEILIIGSGANGLAAAFYLAKAGLRPIVLEARAAVGGGAITEEIHPGFHCPTLSHEVLLHAQVRRDMALDRHGLTLVAPDARVCALPVDGPPLVLHDDPARSAASIAKSHGSDGQAYERYTQAVAQVAGVLSALLEQAPPDLDAARAGDVWQMLGTLRRFRALGQRDRYRLLRWVPMPIADLMDEWFGADLLRAAVAAAGVSGTMLGPRSAGSSLVMLLRESHRLLAGGSALRVRGGPGSLTAAMAAAARAAGAEIRLSTPVERIVVRHERVAGVVAGGRELPARVVLSAADPRTTFLRLIDPMDLTPDFALKMRNYRASGIVAKVNLALAALPAFRGITGAAALSGRIHIGPGLDYLERAFDHAKYGEMSAAPWLDITIPSIADPSMAPAGGHVASIYVHVAPYRLREGWTAAAREALLRTTMAVLETYAPGIGALVLRSQVLSPADLEQEYGFAGGHIFHGELAADQLFTMRPLLGYGRYASPIPGLYLCGGGTHPGGFLTGASGRLAAARIVAGAK